MARKAYGVSVRALACASGVPWQKYISRLPPTRRVTRRGGFLLHEKYFFSRCFSLDCVFCLTIMSSESLIVDYPYR